MVDSLQSSISNVYAVVVTYNGAATIETCLSSLTDSAYPVSIIVVDNNSTDDTVDKCQQFSNVKCLIQDKNLGFGQANNIGIQYALNHEADYVFLLNQDAYIQPEAIKFLIETALANLSYGILSPIHLNGDGTRIDSKFLSYLLADEGPDFLAAIYLNNVQKSVYTSKFLNAAAWLVTRDLFNTVGGFDPLFFMYGEDLDLCERTLFHNFKIGLVPQAKIYHYRESPNTSTNGLKALYFKCQKKASSIIVTVKTPNGSLIKRAVGKSIDVLPQFLRLMLAGHFEEAIITLIGYLIFISKFFQISRHHYQSKIKNPHWLNLP